MKNIEDNITLGNKMGRCKGRKYSFVTEERQLKYREKDGHPCRVITALIRSSQFLPVPVGVNIHTKSQAPYFVPDVSIFLLMPSGNAWRTDDCGFPRRYQGRKHMVLDVLGGLATQFHIADLVEYVCI